MALPNFINPDAEGIAKVVDFRKEKDIADAIGMPDQTDYDNLSKIIRKFERQNPGLIAYTLQEARRQFEAGKHGHRLSFGKQDAIISEDSNMVYAFELPTELYKRIEKVFPSMFRSKKHLKWFKQNFPKLTIAKKA